MPCSTGLLVANRLDHAPHLGSADKEGSGTVEAAKVSGELENLEKKETFDQVFKGLTGHYVSKKTKP